MSIEANPQQIACPCTARILVLLATVVATNWMHPAAAEADDPTDAVFRDLVHRIWEFDMRRDPLFATHVGDHRFNDRLPQKSPRELQRQRDAVLLFRDELQKLDIAKLSAAQQINAQILLAQLNHQLDEFHFQSHLVPITNRDGFHIDFPELRRRVPLRTEADFRNYIARLKAFREYADGHMELMRAGIEQGVTLPSIVLAGYEQPIESQLVDQAEKSLLYEPLTRLPGTIPADVAEELRTQARKAIQESVLPGYENFLKFMKEEYVPHARDTIAASALPNGREFYQHRVRWFTTLDLTPEQVHATGQREVSRIRAEMEAVKERAGFEGDLAAFIEFLRTDPQFYAARPEELMKTTALVLKRMDGALPKLFRTLPRSPYGIREVPAYVAPLTTTAYYQPAPADGTDAGYYFVNTYNLSSRPLYEVEALSLHEAVPGHHLQIALQQELTELPPFRRFTGFTAYVEGWALYAERLGLEVGFYEDPYCDFGRLTYEMWRACRLVVDTGMHAMGWSREDAIRFMEVNSALSKHNIRAEVDRYIAWPGQALGYKIGELKIRELRALAETKLGDQFDVREFHDVVLSSGAVPLYMLENRVQAWIEQASAH